MTKKTLWVFIGLIVLLIVGGNFTNNEFVARAQSLSAPAANTANQNEPRIDLPALIDEPLGLVGSLAGLRASSDIYGLAGGAGGAAAGTGGGLSGGAEIRVANYN